jgi:NADH:ubiquinone reductase (H+-translocating)
VTDLARVLVLGSGFAGLWAALGAARRLDQLGVAAGTVDITMVSSKPYHDIRVRNYETDLGPARIPLSDLLDPVGIKHITGDVTAIDASGRTVESTAGAHGYDRLVLAVGSQVVKPDIPGLRRR